MLACLPYLGLDRGRDLQIDDLRTTHLELDNTNIHFLLASESSWRLASTQPCCEHANRLWIIVADRETNAQKQGKSYIIAETGTVPAAHSYLRLLLRASIPLAELATASPHTPT